MKEGSSLTSTSKPQSSLVKILSAPSSQIRFLTVGWPTPASHVSYRTHIIEAQSRHLGADA